MKIKVGDKVLFKAGKERHKKDKTGTVVKTLKNSEKVVVEKRNIKVKHIKKTATEAGRKIEFESPIPVSNLMVVCPKCSKATRVGYKKLDNGKKQRICKKCGESLDSSSQSTKVKAK